MFLDKGKKTIDIQDVESEVEAEVGAAVDTYETTKDKEDANDQGGIYDHLGN